MNPIGKIVLAVLLSSSVGACAHMSRADTGTAIGAATGAVVGNAVSGGGVLGTVGGAAIGGVLGREAAKR